MCGTHESLTQVHDWSTEDGESWQRTHYFHCDQIGIPREMTDKDGNLLWFGNYTGKGRLKEETKVTNPSACKTNIPTVRRGYITTSSGITILMRGGLLIRIRLDYGRTNLYQFGFNTTLWIDIYGLSGTLTIHSSGRSSDSSSLNSSGGSLWKLKQLSHFLWV